MITSMILATLLSATTPAEFSPAEVASVEQSFHQYMRSKRANGGAMIVTDGRNTVTTTYGVRDEKGSPFLITTPNRIASVSKTVTAVAVLLLVQEGKVSLDAPVLDILNKDRERPITPREQAMRSITVRQLLQHHGGFGSDTFIFEQLKLAQNFGLKLPAAPDKLVELTLTTQTLSSAPGSGFKYSNIGYLILGRVIEKVSGKRYEDYVQTAVLAPAGISKDEAFIASAHTPREQETHYWDLMGRMGISIYSADNRSRVPFPYGVYAPESMDAYGGWAMSVQALIKFQLALPKLLKPEMQRQVTAPPPTARGRSYTGLGFMVIAESLGGYTIQHGGDLEGCNAAIMYRANGQVIAVVSNTGGPPNDNGWSFTYINSVLCPLLNQMAQ